MFFAADSCDVVNLLIARVDKIEHKLAKRAEGWEWREAKATNEKQHENKEGAK